MSSTPRAFLYMLVDPRAPRHPRYVGVTGDPVLRLKKHRICSSGGAPIRRWVASLKQLGLVPDLVILADFGSREEALAAEWRTIARWKDRGLCDVNAQPLMLRALEAHGKQITPLRHPMLSIRRAAARLS